MSGSNIPSLPQGGCEHLSRSRVADTSLSDELLMDPESPPFQRKLPIGPEKALGTPAMPDRPHAARVPARWPKPPDASGPSDPSDTLREDK